MLASCSATIAGDPTRQQGVGLQQALPTSEQVASAVGNPLDAAAPPAVGDINLLPNGIRNSKDVSPLDCLGAVSPLMRVVYEKGDVRGVGLQDFARYGQGMTVSSVHAGVVRFASDIEAARMFSSFISQWRSCADTRVSVHITETADLQWTVTDVRQTDGILSATILTGAADQQSAFPTEHAIGLAADCIVDVDVAITDVQPARRVAAGRAGDLVRLMLENVSRGR